MAEDDPSIFISYAAPDLDRVLPVARGLLNRGLNVWMDKLRLRAGHNWDFEIKRALDRAAIVIVFASHNSVTRRGYIQREIKLAVDKAKEKLISDIYLIPVLLDDDLDYPDELKAWQAVRLSEPDSETAIAEAIEHQFATLSDLSQAAQVKAGFQWRPFAGRESWDGLPGYDVAWSAYRVFASDYPELSDVNALIDGKIAEAKMEARRIKLSQTPDIYSFGHAQEMRTETLDIRYAEPVVCGRVLSILSAHHFYSPGAAHGNSGYESQVFLLTPLVQIRGLDVVFNDPDKALEIVRAETRSRLLASGPGEDEELHSLDETWVNAGTEDWGHLQIFRFLESGLELTFPPYAVACYADGPQTVLLPWKVLAPLMRGDYAAAAGVGNLIYGDPTWTIEDAGDAVAPS